MNAKHFLSDPEKQQVVQAIQQAELQTSGEIMLHIEDRCKGVLLDRAAQVFADLELHKTDLRNGVLMYVAVKDHQFAILGDKGINVCVDGCCWDDICDRVLFFFQKGCFADGLVEGIHMTGERLKKYFPYQENDVNELCDDISFGTEEGE